MKKKLLLPLIVVVFFATLLLFLPKNQEGKKLLKDVPASEEQNTLSNVPNSKEDNEVNPSSNTKYLNEIAMKVINRQIIPDTYFVFIENKDLIESISNYNKLTIDNRLGFYTTAVDLLNDFYGLEIGRLEIASASADVRGIVEKVIQYNLYKNMLELMQGDADFAQTFYKADTQEEWNETCVDNPWTRFFTDEKWVEGRSLQYATEEYWATIDSVTEQLKKEGASIDNTLLIDQILNREVIKDTYLNFIEDPEIAKAIQDYNKLTAQYIFQHTPRSITAMITQSELQTFDVEYKFNYFDRLDEVEMFAAQVSKYALYGNCSDLIYAMPDLAFDGGSGVGRWPAFFQQVPQEEFDAYLSLVDSLIISLK